MDKTAASTPAHSEYTQHLAAMGRVQACADIYNANGLLLLKAGEPISPRRGELLAIHKLLKPLHDSISILDALSAEQFSQSLNQLINQHPDLVQQESSWQIVTVCSQWAQHLLQQTLPQQMLTVLAERLPQIYQKSLFIGWFACGVAKGMGLSLTQQRDALLTGLLHEIGMLYLPHRLMQADASYSASDWKRMQSHTLLGQKLLTQCKGMPYEVRRGVLEHHERADGSGYPRGLSGADIHLQAAIVAVADTLQAIRFGNHQPALTSLRQVLPVLQVSGDLYHEKACQAAILEVRKACQEQPRFAKPELVAMAAELSSDLLKLQHSHNELSSLLPALRRFPRNSGPHQSLLVSAEHFVNTVNQAGFFLDTLPESLQQIEWQLEEIDPQTQLSIEESQILIKEMNFLLKRIRQKSQLLLQRQLLPEPVAERISALFATSTRMTEPA